VDAVSYDLNVQVLKVRVPHMRRGTMSSLLFSLAQKALRLEERDFNIEQVHCHLTGDGDYMGLLLVDTGDADDGVNISLEARP
jgi:hypothetical protein